MLEVRQVTQLSPAEAQRLFGWSPDMFGTGDLNLTYRSKEGVVRFVLCAGDDGVVSHTAVLKHHATANGAPALIGGIGGVVTIPSVQGRGYAAALVRHAADFLRDEWAVDFALLFCIDRMVPYYGRLGWRNVMCEVLIDQPAGRQRCPFNVMTLPFNAKFAVIDSIDLRSAPW
jgi:GNAT superfamily N-acetyltransferase